MSCGGKTSKPAINKSNGHQINVDLHFSFFSLSVSYMVSYILSFYYTASFSSFPFLLVFHSYSLLSFTSTPSLSFFISLFVFFTSSLHPPVLSSLFSLNLSSLSYIFIYSNWPIPTCASSWLFQTLATHHFIYIFFYCEVYISHSLLLFFFTFFWLVLWFLARTCSFCFTVSR